MADQQQSRAQCEQSRVTQDPRVQQTPVHLRQPLAGKGATLRKETPSEEHSVLQVERRPI